MGKSNNAYRVIFTGRISNGILFTVVDGKEAFSEDPAGIAFSTGLIEAALSDGVKSIVVIDTSSDALYKTDMETFRDLRRMFIFDGRERWLLEFRYWNREIWEQPALLTVE